MHTLDAFRFDKSQGRWTAAAGREQASRPQRLVLVTFNVWFGDYRWQERLSALLDLVRACRPDVVALQEVTPRHLEQILRVDWVRQGYWISDVTGHTVEPHGVLLLSRVPLFDLALKALPSDKDRKLLLGTLGLDGPAVCVGTLHLESSVDATPMRLAQLDTVLPSLQQVPHAVLMGDFNFDPSQELEQSLVEPHFQDLWAELRGDEPGYTEDTDINRMRLLHKGKEKQVRFDRILLRSSRPGWRPGSIGLIGTEPIAPGNPEVFPSDHFGLTGSLVWSDAHEIP